MLTHWTYGRSAPATAFTRGAAHQELKSPNPRTTQNALEVGTDRELRFGLSISDPWKGTARIVWTRRPDEEHPYPVGTLVHLFDLPPPDARLAIAAFVAKPLATPAPSKESKYGTPPLHLASPGGPVRVAILRQLYIEAPGTLHPVMARGVERMAISHHGPHTDFATRAATPQAVRRHGMLRPPLGCPDCCLS